MSRLNPKDAAGCTLLRNGQAQAVPGLQPIEKLSDVLSPKGFWKVELWRKGRPILLTQMPNLITLVGKTYMLGVACNSTTQIATANWYSGLISDATYSAISVNDTMASHAGWTEFTSYSQATRPAWGPGSPTTSGSNAQITNASPITFSITSSGTIKGLFINGASSGADTKGGTTGTLLGVALFVVGDVPVVNTDELRCVYTIVI